MTDISVIWATFLLMVFLLVHAFDLIGALVFAKFTLPGKVDLMVVTRYLYSALYISHLSLKRSAMAGV